MSVSNQFLTIAVAAVVCLAVQPAFATTVTVKFEGNIHYSSYDTGVFGHGSGSNVLSGLSATANFVYDTDLGSLSESLTQKALLNGPFTSANIVVDKTQYNFTPDSTAYAQVTSGVENIAGYYAYTGGSTFLEGVSQDAAIPFALDQSYSITPDGAGDEVYFQIYDTSNILQAYGYINPSSISVVAASPVPLPAAFPMFASALGAAGFFLRGRRKKSVHCALS